MDLKDLRSRIDSIQQKAGNNRRTVPEKKPDPGESLAKTGWKRTGNLVYEKITDSGIKMPSGFSTALMPPDYPGSKLDMGKLVFYDTETTGLSSGAGNIIFLAGFGYYEGESLLIAQIILADFPGEPYFLQRISDYILPDRVYVSYNGKAFDSNLIRSRFSMNGMNADFGYQLDLLFPARRLWKEALGSCSLGDIERKVLNKNRIDDVPGALVPDMYFNFIRSGDSSWIEKAASHHLDDIASLALLLEQMDRVLDNPPDYPDCSLTALAGIIARRDPGKAENILRKDYLKTGSLSSGRDLADMLKRSGRYTEAAAIWDRLWSERGSVQAAIELAKHLEHRRNDFEAALGLTESLLGLERFRTAGIRSELEKRKDRLIKRLSRSGCNRSCDS